MLKVFGRVEIPPVCPVYLTLEALEVDPLNKSELESLAKLNPRKQVPFILDGEFALS